VITPKDLIERWRTDAEDAKARGYLKAWHQLQSCASELEAALSAQPTTDLRPWVQHLPSCPRSLPRIKLDLGRGWTTTSFEPKPCSCGLDAKIAALAASSPVQPQHEKEQGDTATRVDSQCDPATSRTAAVNETKEATVTPDDYRRMWMHAVQHSLPDNEEREPYEIFAGMVVKRFAEACKMNRCARCGDDVSVDTITLCGACRDGNQPPSGVREDPAASRTLDAPHAHDRSSPSAVQERQPPEGFSIEHAGIVNELQSIELLRDREPERSYTWKQAALRLAAAAKQEIGTLQTLKAAWEKRAYEAEAQLSSSSLDTGKECPITVRCDMCAFRWPIVVTCAKCSRKLELQRATAESLDTGKEKG
jgi:hypothetical protein